MIRDARSADAVPITDIYNHYVLNSSVTFEETQLQPSNILDRINEAATQKLPYLVYEERSEGVIGYAYASKWKGRCAYRHSVEVSIYLHPEQSGQGLGTALYSALFKLLSERGYHVAIGGIALPNPASIALHEKLGMTKVAHFKEIGFKFGHWVDVGYWQALLSNPADID